MSHTYITADADSYYYYTEQYLEPYSQQVDEALKLSDTIPFETRGAWQSQT